MVTYSCYPGDARPRRTIDALLGQGMEVDLVCLMDGANPSVEKRGRLRVTRLGIEHKRAGKLTYAWQYSAFILQSSCILAARSLRRKYDLVYINNMPDILVISALVPKGLGAKVILDLHDPMPELMMTIYSLPSEHRSVRIITALEKWSLARAHRVLTVNLACKHLFGSRSCSPDKVGVVMNAPDDSIFHFHPPAEIQETSRANDAPFVIMYHGSLVERNGLDLAVEALRQLRPLIKNAELRIYGRKTPYLDRILEDVRNSGLEDAARYLGPRSLEDLVVEIEKCDVGVIPNHNNPFTQINTPTRIFEYLSVGKVVIAPNTRGILEYFNSDSLFFFETGNAADLARQIYKAFAYPEQARNTAIRGQEVFQAHTWKQEKRSLLEYVDELVGVTQLG